MSRHSSGLLVWEDLLFPAAAINPPGGASDPDYDATVGGWLFDATGTELLFIQAQLPHSWARTVLKPHVHWQKTTSAAGNVLWRLEYRWARIGEAMDGSWTTLDTTTAIVSDQDTADVHAISAFDEIPRTTEDISDMLLMKFSRIGGDASDTYGADARLLEFDIHYQKNALGSEYEYERAQ